MHVGSVFDTKRSSGGVSLDVIFHTSRTFALFSVSCCSRYNSYNSDRVILINIVPKCKFKNVPSVHRNHGKLFCVDISYRGPKCVTLLSWNITKIQQKRALLYQTENVQKSPQVNVRKKETKSKLCKRPLIFQWRYLCLYFYPQNLYEIEVIKPWVHIQIQTTSLQELSQNRRLMWKHTG